MTIDPRTRLENLRTLLTTTLDTLKQHEQARRELEFLALAESTR